MTWRYLCVIVMFTAPNISYLLKKVSEHWAKVLTKNNQGMSTETTCNELCFSYQMMFKSTKKMASLLLIQLQVLKINKWLNQIYLMVKIDISKALQSHPVCLRQFLFSESLSVSVILLSFSLNLSTVYWHLSILLIIYISFVRSRKL